MLVLVAEDNRRMAEFLRRGLQEKGFAVDLAHDGEDAAAMVSLFGTAMIRQSFRVRTGRPLLPTRRGPGSVDSRWEP